MRVAYLSGLLVFAISAQASAQHRAGGMHTGAGGMHAGGMHSGGTGSNQAMHQQQQMMRQQQQMMRQQQMQQQRVMHEQQKIMEEQRAQMQRMSPGNAARLGGSLLGSGQGGSTQPTYDHSRRRTGNRDTGPQVTTSPGHAARTVDGAKTTSTAKLDEKTAAAGSTDRHKTHTNHQTSTGQTSTGQTSTAQTSTAQTSTGQTSTGQTSTSGRATTGKHETGKLGHDARHDGLDRNESAREIERLGMERRLKHEAAREMQRLRREGFLGQQATIKP